MVCTAPSTSPLDCAYSGDDEICSNRYRAVTPLRQNPSGNWLILKFKPCNRIILIISHSFSHFSRAIDVISCSYGNPWKQMLNFTKWYLTHEFSEFYLCFHISPEIWHLLSFSGSYEKLPLVLLQITSYSGATARAKRARSGAPWVRKKPSIPENLVMM